MFYNEAKKTAIAAAQKAERSYNAFGQRGNDLALNLYSLRKSAAKAIDRVEVYVNSLANTPIEFIRDVADVKLQISEFNIAVKIEEENTAGNIKGAGAAGVGVAAGGAIAALGPTAAMAIATTFGAASTGTAIASLSGAAAANAALAWLGGGALAAGGGGMAAGNALLALAGPIGWGVAGVFVVGGGVFAAKKNKEAAKKANEYAIDLTKKINKLKPKVSELERLNSETKRLKSTLDIALMINTYPKNYLDFNADQKQVLATLINNTTAMGKLINKRVS